jgi:cell division protein FtsW|tara:strand:+ start:3052 stop:4194 length:1143 start_codon:yes stop_codon:yes gene_type:complete
MLISRSDNSNIALWWWTIDRFLLTLFSILIIVGIFLVMASSQHLAQSFNIFSHYFTLRHILFVIISLPIIFLFSLLNEKQTKAISIIGLIITIFLLLIILINGSEIKGAKRWIYFSGFSFQPSELCKPFYVIVNAWFLTLWIEGKNFPGWAWSIVSLILISSLLLIQPDVGMTIVIILTWCFQLFITGIPLIIIICLTLAVPLFVILTYHNFDHVKIRIDGFLEGTTYQVTKSLQSFEFGGFWGTGPGEGFYKKFLPDAHSDFVFAVAAEEYGILICLIIILIYSLVVYRAFSLSFINKSLFFIIAVSGLAFQFGIQTLIHMASNTNLIPTKGMTLPFLSYGGSSMISSAITVGILLSLTRKNISHNPIKKQLNLKSANE